MYANFFKICLGNLLIGSEMATLSSTNFDYYGSEYLTIYI